MKPSISFVVEGDAKPKQSYKHSKHGGYTPAPVKEWQHLVAWKAREARLANPGFEPFMNGDKVQVSVHFDLTHHRRVDLDNLSKAVLDGLNEVLWDDDRCVVDLHLTKSHGKEEGKVYITVLEAQDE